MSRAVSTGGGSDAVTEGRGSRLLRTFSVAQESSEKLPTVASPSPPNRKSGRFNRKGQAEGTTSPIPPPRKGGGDAPAILDRPTREIIADVEISTKAILLSARLYVKVHFEQEGDRGVLYSGAQRRALIEFSRIKCVRVDNPTVFALEMDDDSELSVRVREGSLSLVQDFAKWVSFVSGRPIGSVLRMDAPSASSSSPYATISRAGGFQARKQFLSKQEAEPDNVTTSEFEVPEMEYESLQFAVAGPDEVVVTEQGTITPMERKQILDHLANDPDCDESTTLIVEALMLDELQEEVDVSYHSAPFALEDLEELHGGDTTVTDLTDEQIAELQKLDQEARLADGPVAVVVCPECGEVVPADVPECSACGENLRE